MQSQDLKLFIYPQIIIYFYFLRISDISAHQDLMRYVNMKAIAALVYILREPTASERTFEGR